MAKHFDPADYDRPYFDGMTGPYYAGGIPDLPAVKWARRFLLLGLLVVAIVIIGLVGGA